MTQLHVAVIGAGAAGLCASRFLSAKPDIFTHDIFEQTKDVGGTWVYTEQTGTDQWGLDIHSSMYKYLCTNFPKELMAFPDFPFPEELPSFMEHQDVNAYLENYANKFDVVRRIKFNHLVLRITPNKPHSDDQTSVKWIVTVKDLLSSCVSDHVYDAVFLCNGHYSKPKFPDISGADGFKGKIVHSHTYRIPEVYQNQTVVCLGAGPSGTDIALEIAPFAKHVVLSHNLTPFTCPLPVNVVQKPGIVKFDGDFVVFGNGDTTVVDTVIMCTGYYYTFSFLTPECKTKVIDHRVVPMYKHFLHIEHPSLVFIGLPQKVPPFIVFHYQVQFALKVLEGVIQLPSREQMLSEAEADLKHKLDEGQPQRYAHYIGAGLKNYISNLCEIAELDNLRECLYRIYSHNSEARKNNLMIYKKMNYRIVDDVDFEVIWP